MPDSLDVQQKIHEHEWRLNGHDKAIKDLNENHRTMSETLDGINRNLAQIKWMGLGAIGMYVVSKLGLFESLKLLF